MPSFIRDPKDFWSGVIFVIFGLAAVIIGRDYSMGTAGRMGPAYFPTILGGLLVLIGSIGVVRSMFKSGGAIGRFEFQPALPRPDPALRSTGLKAVLSPGPQHFLVGATPRSIVTTREVLPARQNHG